MSEIVKLYDHLVNHNEIVNQDDRLTIEIATHPLNIQVWDIYDGTVIKTFFSFQSANAWFESRILGLTNG